MKYLFLIGLIATTSALAKENGRYQLYTFPKYVNRSILLDTQTGRMWTDKCLKQTSDGKDCQHSAWSEDDIIGINTDWQKIAKEHAAIQKNENISNSGESK